MLQTSVQAVDRRIVLDGHRLHYRVSGRPDGHPVIMLHGIMGHAREWDLVVEAMSRDGRVHAVDQRGHGESNRSRDYSLAAMIDDVVGFIRELGLAPARIVGHSMGGMVAMGVAAAHPELVDRIVVIDIAPDSVVGEMAAGLREFLLMLGSSSYATVDEAYEVWADDPYARPELLRHYVEHCLRVGADGRLHWKFDGRGLVDFIDHVDETRLWETVDALTVPVLLLRGEASPLVSRATAEEMVRRMARGRLVEIPGGAHDLGVQRPEPIAEAVLDFFCD